LGGQFFDEGMGEWVREKGGTMRDERGRKDSPKGKRERLKVTTLYRKEEAEMGTLRRWEMEEKKEPPD